MATAAELLADVLEVDRTLVIDSAFRTINIPSSVPNLGVEYDDDVLRLDFKMPRYVSNTDLSGFSIRINYINAKGESDAYTVKDAVVGSDYITFTWLVGPTATRYKGNTKFIVCAKTLKADGTDDEGNTIYVVDREFNTTIATLPVLEGLEVDESIVSEYSDLIEQWRRELFGIGDTEEASIKAVSQNEQTAIENKGAEVLATIPAEYTETAEAAQEGIRTKADAIVCTAQGETIAVSDSSDDHVRGLRVLGKTMQIQTTGKNLLPKPTSGYGTRNGVTFTDMGDGRIGIIGTASSNTTQVFCSFSPGERTLIPAGTYTVSGSPGSTAYLSFFIYADQETEDILMSNASLINGKTWTFTLENDAYYGAYIYVGNGKSPNEIVSPQLELGSVATEYEPYSDGVASPSPTYPQSLTNVGSSGNIGIWVTGKNLLRDVNIPATSTLRGLTSDYEGNGVFHIHGTFEGTEAGYQLSTTDLNIPMDPDAKYTLSVKLISGQPPDDFHPYIGVGSDTTAVKNWIAANVDGTTAIGEVNSVTASGRSAVKDATTIKRFWIYGYNSDLTAYTADFRIQVWLEKNETSTEFEPYIEYLATASTPNALPAIPVSEDGNYTDANGQQWICDEIDFERGMHIQRVGIKVFDGSTDENWAAYAKQYYVSVKDKRNNYVEVSNALLCSHFRVASVVNTSMGYISETYWYNGNVNVLINYDDGVGGVDNFVAWLQSNPITVHYVLATPIETPLTAEEIAAFKALRTNCPNTTAFNDAGATMELIYNADTKTWLENLPKATDEQVRAAVDAWLTAHYTSAEGASF